MNLLKKILLGLILCCLVVLTACNKESNIYEASNIVVTDHDVSLLIKDGSLSNTQVTLVLENKSEQNLGYGEYYEIEIKKNDAWYSINVELTFLDILYTMESNQSQELEINWEDSYGALSAGEYRILKKVMFMDDNFEEFYVAAEFTIG